MLKVATIVGTRPEIIRLSEIIKLADKSFDHILIHTGQNYDFELSQVFFDELGIRRPDFFLNVAGKHLGETIGNVITRSYEVLRDINPDALLVLGDTNSVLCTISAKRLKIPIFHMESGNRCFDQRVPEEINRKISDHISDVNLCYTEHSRRYLLSEGFRKDHIFVTGSPLYEVLRSNASHFGSTEILNRLGLQEKEYFVVSAHREENIDVPEAFIELCDSVNSVADYYKFPIIFSTHPRTQKQIQKLGIKFNPLVMLKPPFGFFDYVNLQMHSFCVLSDSGTISEESAMMNFPAISIRTSTERPEAIDFGSIILGGVTKGEIHRAIKVALSTASQENEIPLEYTVSNVSSRVIRIIQSYCNIVNKVIWNK